MLYYYTILHQNEYLKNQECKQWKPTTKVDFSILILLPKMAAYNCEVHRKKKSIHVMMEIWGKNFEITNNHQIMKKQHPKNHWTPDPGGFEPVWVGVFWGLQNDATCDLSGFLGQKDIGSQKFLRNVSQGILTSICLIFTVDPIGFRISTTFKHRPQKIPWAWAGHGATALTFRAISFFQQTPVITQHGADDFFHHPKNEENHGFQWG